MLERQNKQLENEKLQVKLKFEQTQKELKEEKSSKQKKRQAEVNDSFSVLDDNLKMVDSGMTPIKRTVQYGSTNAPEIGQARNTIKAVPSKRQT